MKGRVLTPALPKTDDNEMETWTQLPSKNMTPRSNST